MTTTTASRGGSASRSALSTFSVLAATKSPKVVAGHETTTNGEKAPYAPVSFGLCTGRGRVAIFCPKGPERGRGGSVEGRTLTFPSSMAGGRMSGGLKRPIGVPAKTTDRVTVGRPLRAGL